MQNRVGVIPSGCPFGTQSIGFLWMKCFRVYIHVMSENATKSWYSRSSEGILATLVMGTVSTLIQKVSHERGEKQARVQECGMRCSSAQASKGTSRWHFSVCLVDPEIRSHQGALRLGMSPGETSS
jgi:hypothetical protein